MVNKAWDCTCIKAVSKLQLVPVLRRDEEALLSPSSWQPCDTWPQEPPDEEVCDSSDDEGQEQEVHEGVE